MYSFKKIFIYYFIKSILACCSVTPIELVLLNLGEGTTDDVDGSISVLAVLKHLLSSG